MTPRDQRNQQWVLVWLFVWSVSWVAASIAIKSGWVTASPLAVTVAVAPTLLGLAMILAFGKFVREADELQLKIHLEALALGFGVGLVGSVAYRLLERAGTVVDADSADIAALMMVAYAVGVLLGRKRYA
jgi:drug/metabolite transporter (DMT)-like permease